MAQAIASNREGAEVFNGTEICRKKCVELLEELNLPRGLLPLADVEEVGRNRETGFVWLKQSKSATHTFKKIGKTVSYAAEVTAFVEDRRMMRMTGVKSKELLIWISLSEMAVDSQDPTRINFKIPAGISKSFPVSAFDLEE